MIFPFCYPGIGTTLAVLILSIPGLEDEVIPETLRWVFYALLPHFCFGYSLQVIYFVEAICSFSFHKLLIYYRTFSGSLKSVN